MTSGQVDRRTRPLSGPAAPSGVIERSRIGRDSGPEGTLDHIEQQYVATDW